MRNFYFLWGGKGNVLRPFNLEQNGVYVTWANVQLLFDKYLLRTEWLNRM